MIFQKKRYDTFKDALAAKGYIYDTLVVGGRLYSQYTAPNGWRWTYRKYRKYPFTSLTAAEISVNKTLAYEFAQLHGVTVPKTILTDSVDQAKQFLQQYQRVIVKPFNLSGSRGLVLDITENATLESALLEQGKVLVQEQFIGEEFRFTIVRGRVVSVVYRQTPRVIGDGKRTIAELIMHENMERSFLSFPLLTYPQIEDSLITFTIDRLRVPEEGEIVELSRATMIKKGSSFYGMMQSIDQSYIAIAERLAAQINPEFIAVDMMIKNFSQPANHSNYVFIEFNTAPSPVIYSSLRGGDKPAVVDMIADLIDEYANRIGSKI